MRSHRGRFSVLLGIALTPFAGIFGVVFSSLSPLWLFGFFAGPVFLGVITFVAIFKGALYAWPLTCVALPLAAVFIRPVTHVSALAFVLIGLGGGPLSFALMSRMSDGAMNPDSFRSFAIASAFAGIVLGAIFGFVLWRFDRHLWERDEPVESRTLKLGVLLGATFLIFALVGLMLMPPYDRCSGAAVNRCKQGKTF